MAATRRQPHTSLIDRLFREPGRFAFFRAVALLHWAARRSVDREAGDGRQPVGGEALPRREVVRFRVHPGLAFPDREIQALRQPEPGVDGRSGPPEMTVNFLGLTGPQGVLPRHYTDLLIRSIRGRGANRRDAFRDFLDLVHHRILSLFYRAWTKYRLAESYRSRPPDAPDDVGRAILSIAGFGFDHLQNRTAIDDEAWIFYAGLFGNLRRSEVALQSLLEDYFQTPMVVHQFQGVWLALPPEEQTRLSSRQEPEGAHARLGLDAVVGERVFDIQSSFRIRIGPLDYAPFMAFLPEGADMHRLVDLVRAFVGPTLRFEMQLVLRKEAVPYCWLAPISAVASSRPRLGWNTWLKDQDFLQDAADSSFIG